jgi:Zn-dependent alcohol dehydrogenase
MKPMDIPQYIKRCQTAKLTLVEQIAHRFNFDQINLAVEVGKAWRAGCCSATTS